MRGLRLRCCRVDCEGAHALAVLRRGAGQVLACMPSMKSSRRSPIAVVGLGYVGLPLAIEFGKVTPTLEKAVVEGVNAPQAPDAKEGAKGQDKKPDQGYDARARSKMDDLVEKSR